MYAAGQVILCASVSTSTGYGVRHTVSKTRRRGKAEESAGAMQEPGKPRSATRIDVQHVHGLCKSRPEGIASLMLLQIADMLILPGSLGSGRDRELSRSRIIAISVLGNRRSAAAPEQRNALIWPGSLDCRPSRRSFGRVLTLLHRCTAAPLRGGRNASEGLLD
ncbi:hypothetical protein B0T25DRAFT_327962 [Lasiosphaeria hispida]|uniref:Uncharacterized protein n=1 Tax=Lasiosphaeria hispida TaxID=260671 RepID=A0AAJ0HAB9_9PEZI|nr:hypothetical protein B0T25DRAFT_327962 [Lasiosphaeria hispida]